MSPMTVTANFLESFQVKVQRKGAQTESVSVPNRRRRNWESRGPRLLVFIEQSIGMGRGAHKENSRDWQKTPPQVVSRVQISARMCGKYLGLESKHSKGLEEIVPDTHKSL